MSPVLAVSALCLLAYAALHDLAVRTVPNLLSVALFGLGFCARLLDHTLLTGLIVAAGVFALLFAVWLAGGMGGGDVKLWSATALVIRPALAPQLTFFSWVVILGGVMALIYLVLHLFFSRKPGGLAVRVETAKGRHRSATSFLRRLWRAERWRIGRRGPLPYACAIAGGAIAVLAPPLFSTR